MAEYNPPWLELRFRIRARRPGLKKMIVKTFWTFSFTFDTLVESPVTMVKKIFEVFDYKPEKKAWDKIRNGILKGMKKADEEIPSQFKEVARASRKKILAKRLMCAPLLPEEKKLLAKVAKMKSFLIADLLALPDEYQRRLIGRYILNYQSDYQWLLNRGISVKRYVKGNPASLFKKRIVNYAVGTVKVQRGV